VLVLAALAIAAAVLGVFVAQWVLVIAVAAALLWLTVFFARVV
jgi:hypothetical protein